MQDEQRHAGQRIWWGLMLIVIGVLFLLDRYEVLELRSVWHYWPALLIVGGIAQLLWPDQGRRGARGWTEIGLGLWFFACEWNWYGLTWHNGWPLILVIVGVSMLVRSMVERPRVGEGERHV